MERVPPRPVRDGGRPTTRSSPRSASRCGPAGRSAYEKVERRAGDWAVVSCGAAVWMDGGVITDARVGLAAVGPNTTGIPAVSAGAARAGRRRRSCTPRPARSPPSSCTPVTDQRGSADYKRHLAAELTRRALRRAVARIDQRTGSVSMQVTMTVNGERGHPRDRGPAAAGALPARPARPDRHPLGLRHQQLRRLRGLAGRRAGEVVHGAGRDGRRARGAHRRGAGAVDGELDPVQRASCSATACSAASARPG